MAPDTLTIRDDRTGKSYTLPIVNGAIRAMDLRQIRIGAGDFGLLSYDPAFTNTASTISRITEIDGDRGTLRYRGYPIEELAERSNYLEVAYLLVHGELPTLTQMDDWTWQVTHHTWVHENVKKFMDGFHYDAHPMGILISTVAALRRRPSAGTRSPASMLTMSPGTSCSIGSWTREPSRRTLAETTIIFWSAATLAFALPSWFRPIAALSSVRPMSTTPVATWPGRNRLSTPAANSTICIGSRYWRRNACQRGSVGGSANLFGPYLARRASASACVSPCSTVTP